MWEARDQLTARRPSRPNHRDLRRRPGHPLPARVHRCHRQGDPQHPEQIRRRCGHQLAARRSQPGGDHLPHARPSARRHRQRRAGIRRRAPSSIYADTGYNAFASSIASRQKTIYQGANDGMLHAFDATTGAELWAYVPRAAYPRLNALTDPLYSHQFNVDGTPTVGDVDFANTASGGSGNETGAPSWWAASARAARASTRSTSPIRPRAAKPREPIQRRRRSCGSSPTHRRRRASRPTSDTRSASP